jgi:hypothetical protein
MWPSSTKFRDVSGGYGGVSRRIPQSR